MIVTHPAPTVTPIDPHALCGCRHCALLPSGRIPLALAGAFSREQHGLNCRVTTLFQGGHSPDQDAIDLWLPIARRVGAYWDALEPLDAGDFEGGWG